MNTQFHTPSFGDEVFDLTDVEPIPTSDFQMEVPNVNRFNQISMNQPTTNQVEEFKRMNIESPEPVKPVSAYGLFFRDTVSAIKAQNPNTSFEDISKIVQSMWQVLDPSHKNVYNKKNELAKKEYIKQMAAYRNSHLHSDEMSLNNNDQINAIQHPNISPKPAQIASRPAVFTISRPVADASSLPQEPQIIAHNNIVFCNNMNEMTAQNNANMSHQPLLDNDVAVQICIRENCNKRAIINPDWEDEYCSNECVVIHCRNVFNQWVKSNMEEHSKGEL